MIKLWDSETESRVRSAAKNLELHKHNFLKQLQYNQLLLLALQMVVCPKNDENLAGLLVGSIDF